MTAVVSRLASGVSGHVLVAVAGLAVGGLLVWPVVSGFVPRPPGGEVAMYSCPGDGSQVGVIRAGDQVLVTGRTADGAWVEVQYGGPGLARAYVPASVLTVDGDVATLPVSDCLAPPAVTGPNPSLTAIANPGAATPTPSATPTATPTASSSGSPSPTPTKATAKPTPTRTPRTAPGTHTPTPTPPRQIRTPTPAPATPTPTAVPPAPVATFTLGPAPRADWYTIRVTDASTGDITSRAWDFDNDGSIDSTKAGPVNWRYSTTGTKTVRLTVTGPGGSDVATKQLSVTQPNLSAYTLSDDSICVQVENHEGPTGTATVVVRAWQGVDSVVLTLDRPPLGGIAYPYNMASIGIDNKWSITLGVAQMGTTTGTLHFHINGLDGSFQAKTGDHTIDLVFCTS